MYRRARNRRIRTENAAITIQRFENGSTRLALIKPLTRICRHGFSFEMPTVWTCQRGFKNNYCFCRCHIAYPVRIRNPANMGSKIASLYKTPNNPARPSAVRTIGNNGVKQHNAASSVPPMPNARSLFFMRLTFVVPTGSCSLKFDLYKRPSDLHNSCSDYRSK